MCDCFQRQKDILIKNSVISQSDFESTKFKSVWPIRRFKQNNTCNARQHVRSNNSMISNSDRNECKLSNVHSAFSFYTKSKCINKLFARRTFNHVKLIENFYGLLLSEQEKWRNQIAAQANVK